MNRKVAWTGGLLALGVVAYVGSHLAAQPNYQAQRPATSAVAEPHTRIALVNLQYVIKSYQKYVNFQNEIKGNYKYFEEQINAKKKMIEGHQAQLAKTTLPADQEKLQKEMRAWQREIEDVQLQAKEYLGKKTDDQLVILYREVQDAASRYAQAHNFDLVLQYTDATTDADLYTPMNVARKLQGTNGACVPLYASPGMNISEPIAYALNAAYNSARAATQGATGTQTPAPK